MKQLVEPNLLAKGQVGWCLSYVKEVFDTPIVYPSAWRAWEGAQFKHTDALPEDVAVPVFFSYWGTIAGIYDNWGHVVVHVPGKGFYSSPWKQSQSFAVLGSIEEVERLYGCKYVGWSEDVNNVRVAGADMPEDYIVNDGDIENYFVGFLGRKPNEQDLQVYRGTTHKQIAYAIMGSDEFKARINKIDELTKALALYQAANGDIEATMVGKALIKLIQTFGYKKGA